MPADEAFTFMADLRNFAEWDPGVTNVEQIEDVGAGADGVFDVTVKGFPKDLVLRYHTTEFDPSTKVVARAESKLLTSLDTITVTPDGGGSVVTYDAELTLNGPFRLADPVLKLMFGRIGNRAASGLVKALDGARVTADQR
jgi:carbon monoxide dehydrogenase subunit G